MTHAPSPADLSATRTGFTAAILAYGLWGLLPLYFHVLPVMPAQDFLAHRILWSFPTGLVLVLLAGQGGALASLFASPRKLAPLVLSALLISLNWFVYIRAVQSGHILEASLGYFINPLVNFILAAAFLGERFTRLQLAAVALALLGVLNQAVSIGVFPWTALTLALTFGFYALVRKMAPPVDARVGLTVEVAFLAPAALAFLLLARPAGGEFFATREPAGMALVAASGLITATPLILFAIGARRLRLSTIGLMQYVAPTLQFGIGLWFGEHFTPGHAVTFGLIWAGVALFSFSVFQTERRKAQSLRG